MLSDRMRMKFYEQLIEQIIDVQDATVVASAYDTSGNGGRKLVRLEDGWFVAISKDSITDVNKPVYKLFVSSDNGETWVEDSYSISAFAGVNDVSLVSIGNTLHLLSSSKTSSNIWRSRHHYKNFDTGVTGYSEIETSTQTDMKNVSLAINDTGTELHAAWASKNSTYPNSFNIRYAKGTINADGSVTWGAVEQVTAYNTSGYDQKNPSITRLSDRTLVTYEGYDGTNYKIKCMTLPDGSSKSLSDIYNGGSRTQSSPSAIFVPQSVNGLVNGRIWVAWHGTDSGNSSNRLRVSYSDDGGLSWSSMELLNTSSRFNPSITANKSNEIFVSSESSIGYGAILSKDGNSSDSWSINSIGSSMANLSTLFDPTFTLDFSEPLFICQDNENSKVGFYGTWTQTQ